MRALFEATAWSTARRIASPVKADRDTGMAELMSAFDEAVRTRRHRPVTVDVRAEAEAARAAAQLLHRDWPEVTAPRLAELAEAVRDAPWAGAYKRTRAGSYRRKTITEEEIRCA